jgi:predicted ATPase
MTDRRTATQTVHLRSMQRVGNAPGRAAVFPFTVPAIRTLEEVDLSAAVTFFVGENGSGKSTVLEAMASLAGLPAVGSADVSNDVTLALQRSLTTGFRLVWNRRTRRGFFLRAEDFFGFVKRLARMRTELTDRLNEVDRDFADASDYARGLAAGPARASLAELTARYGENLDANSHGETFLRLFKSRLVPGGLYLMDEPEAALSPKSQLGLLALIAETVAVGGQFVIATHSPILLAFPGAAIYSFDSLPIARTDYADLEHVNLTRAFLTQPERYLRHLIEPVPEPD